MATIANLLVNIDTNVAKFTDDMQRMSHAVESGSEKINKALETIKRGFEALAVFEVFKKIVESGAEAEKAMVSVNQVLKSTSEAAGVTQKSIEKLSDALEKQTGVSHVAIEQTSALLLIFTKIGKDVFPKAVTAINDLSVALGKDLHASTILVGKALQDPIKGLTALTKAGVQFTADQKGTIKSLVETGHQAEAQGMILKELEIRFGGAAAAARDTFGGALKALGTQINDLLEQIGLGVDSGLRGAVEFLIVAIQHGQKAIESFQAWLKSSSESAAFFKKALQIAGGIFSWIVGEIQLAINIFAELTRLVIEGCKFIGKVLEVAGKGIYDNLTKPWKDAADAVGNFMTKLGASIATGPARANELMRQNGKDVAGDWGRGFMGEFDKIKAEADKNMADMAKAHANYKGPGLPTDDGAGDTTAKEAEKNLKKIEAITKAYEGNLAALNKVVDAETHRGDAYASLTKEMKDQLNLADGMAKIEAQKGVGQLDKEIAKMKLKAAWVKSIAQEQDAADTKERDAAQKHLDDLKVQQEALDRQLAGLPPITEELKKQAEIDKLIAAGDMAAIPLLKEQLDVLKHMEATKQKIKEQAAYDTELKKIDDIVAGYKEEQEAIIAKANGYEHMLPLLKQERDIQLEIKKINEGTGTADEKQQKTDVLSGKMQDLQSAFAATQQLNDAIKQQDNLVNSITSSTHGYYNQTQDLQKAFQAGQITLDQYTNAWQKLQQGTKAASSAGQEFGNLIGTALTDALTKGQKLTDVFKNLAKSLENMAIKKLLVDPLQQKAGMLFDNVARNLFGVGGTNGVAGNAPLMQQLPPGVTRQMLAAQTGQAFSPYPGLGNSGASLAPNSTPGLTPWGSNFLGSSGVGNPLGSGSTTGMPGVNGGGGQQPIYSYGPVTLMGAGGTVDLNNPANVTLNNATLNAPALTPLIPTSSPASGNQLGAPGGSSGGGGLLGGLLSGIGGFISHPLESLGNLFGGGAGGGGLGGIGKGLFNAIGGIFRADGGSFGAGQPMVVGEKGPELSIPGASGMIISNQQIRSALAQVVNGRIQSGLTSSSPPGIDTFLQSSNAVLPVGQQWSPEQQAFFGPNAYNTGGDAAKYQDLLAATGRTSGTPLYKLTPGFIPDLPPDVKAFLDKNRAYQALSPDEKQQARTTGNGYPSNDGWTSVMGYYNAVPFGLDGELRNVMRNQDVAFADYTLGQTSYGPSNSKMWAADILSNHTALDRFAGKISLPEGNQLARLLTAWRQVTVPQDLLEFANTHDWLADQIHPSGQWTALQSQSGTHDGSGFGGEGSGMFQGTTIDSGATPVGWGSLGSGLQSFLPQAGQTWGGGQQSGPNNYAWGSGLGYAMGWHQPAAFPNNSMLDPANGIQNPTIPSIYRGLSPEGMLSRLNGPDAIAAIANLSTANGGGYSDPANLATAGLGGPGGLGPQSPLSGGSSSPFTAPSWLTNGLPAPIKEPTVYNAPSGDLSEGYHPIGGGKPMDLTQGYNPISGKGEVSQKSYDALNNDLFKQFGDLAPGAGRGSDPSMPFGGGYDSNAYSPLSSGAGGPEGLSNYAGTVLGGLASGGAKSFGYSSGFFPQPANWAGYQQSYSAGGGTNVSNAYNDAFSGGYGGWGPSSPAQGTAPYSPYATGPIEAGMIDATMIPATTWGGIDSFGGSRMTGGSVEAGKVYTWNEAGREMFRSNRPGEIVSASNSEQKPSQIIINNTVSNTHEVSIQEDLTNRVVNVVFQEIKRSMPPRSRRM